MHITARAVRKDENSRHDLSKGSLGYFLDKLIKVVQVRVWVATIMYGKVQVSFVLWLCIEKKTNFGLFSSLEDCMAVCQIENGSERVGAHLLMTPGEIKQRFNHAVCEMVRLSLFSRSSLCHTCSLLASCFIFLNTHTHTGLVYQYLKAFPG